MGRPTDYTDEKAAEICEWIARGQSLASYCRENEVGYTTVMGWLRNNAAFANNYAGAREAAGDADADLVTDIRDRVLAGTVSPEQARVAIDACKWTAGRRQPKKYGDRIHQDIEAKVSIEDELLKLAKGSA